MSHRIPMWLRVFLSLAFAILTIGPAEAQSTNPNGYRYPYWDTAPQSYHGSRITVPVPGASPNAISNASRSPATGGSMESSIGGGYVPPFVTSADLALRLPRGTRAEADNKAHIWLRVPDNAEVWVEGVKTKQTGESRYFFSPPLTAGKKYVYQMRIRWTKDGKPMEQTQRILVHAGATIHRDFTNTSR